MSVEGKRLAVQRGETEKDSRVGGVCFPIYRSRVMRLLCTKNRTTGVFIIETQSTHLGVQPIIYYILLEMLR